MVGESSKPSPEKGDRDHPVRLIDWTGERCVPWADEVQTIYEHLHRYRLAASFAHGKHVLELASGEGFGAAMLATEAQSVVAVELDSNAVAHSRMTYPLDNLEFTEGSMLHLDGYSNGSFDLVVCFEAIEHVQEQRELIEGIARVMRPDGLVVLSTPDRDAYNAVIHDPNPFHVRELNRAELLDLLQPHFPHVALWGQTGISGSRLTRIDEPPGNGAMQEAFVMRRGDEWTEQTTARPTYLVAVASRLAFQHGGAGGSYLLDASGEAVRARNHLLAIRDTRIAELKVENRVLYSENERLRDRPFDERVRRLARRIRAWVRSS